ncbi:hypothetical protein A3B56_00830 [Candidatus Roizmanbacteria bacterium RIFCSPLOWO2_01_FULL_45_11]|uniref:Prepilin-type N-terminal cleavage/methylation domain-containing protein n=1 Tax=Candidatus Roizmanbacteria bacterium RIFCSPLOWO2_01_FULL_45_11 TaxID=1802070 RepID=A0A1F7JJ89_9BACT|nr:MAG: hypothetical protein A3B56_00830 [Candidatus Roizmanbacteria bacterium RIFCSPLOWO2_01_FULL_45_11]
MKKQLPRGFTLVEMIISVALLAVIGLLMNMILLNSMRAILKAQSVKEVKQTGDFAMSVITQRLRNAVSVASCTAAMNTITLMNPDGTTTTISVVEDPPGSGVRKIRADTGGAIQILTTSNNVTVNTTNTLVFNCTSTTGRIGITYVLDHVRSANLPFEQRASISYATTVVLRNWYMW